ncbi:MAG: FHA domain-containing protein [Bacteroidales bacterium]|nr:FHA domain-containing protein [Bacteroidales bacterium]
MKRIALLVLTLVVACTAGAQVKRGLKGDYDLSKFPEISFTWNSPNPEQLDTSQFIMTENDSSISIKVEHLQTKSNAGVKKNILILWEDMPSHTGQYDYARKLISGFLEYQFSSNDKFNVAVFNRKHDGQALLSPLSSTFTNDVSLLREQVMSYRANKEKFTHPNNSDLYLAINDGIELLKKESADRSNIIIVVTAGLNLKDNVSGAFTEMGPVRQHALDLDIPVYVVKYATAGDTPEINSLAESTYGKHFYDKNNSYKSAISWLQNEYSSFDNRCYGNDYKITFTTSAKKDGKTHPVSLSVNRVQQNLPSFSAPAPPKMTFKDWIEQNLILFICICVGVVLIITLIIILIVHRNRKNKQALDNAKQQLNAEISNSQQQLENLRREQEEKEKQRELEKQYLAQQADYKQRLELMQKKSLYPRLQCSLNGEVSMYNITSPRVTIGRNPDNDIVINDMTVSGHHAEIIFDGTGFELINRSNSYEHIIVNGAMFKQTVLKNGDMIGFGKAVASFYL